MRNGRIVSDGVDLKADGLKSADGRFAAGPGALDNNVHFAKTVILRGFRCLLRSDLRGKGS